MVTRRDFLKTAGVGLVAMLGQRPYLVLAHPSAPLNDDFKALARVSLEEAKTLEEVIAAKPPVQAQDSKILELKVSRYPEIAYEVTIEPVVGNENSVGIRFQSGGGAFLLNKSGFFVSAYHVFEDSVQASVLNAPSARIVIIYSPRYGFAAQADVLDYSLKNDIMLGKINFASLPLIETVRISESDVPARRMLYTPKFADKKYMIGELFERVVASGTVNLDPILYHFGQTSLVPADFKTLKNEVILSSLLDVTFDDGNKLEDEQFIKAKVELGDSGNPVLGLNNTLMGVMRGSVPPQVHGKKYEVGVYSSPSVMRRMISHYLDAVKRG